MKFEKIQRLKERFDQHAQWWDDMHTVEIWKARELMELLGYDQWRNFESAIKRAMEACKNAGVEISLHFQASTETVVVLGKSAEREIDDYILTRYACYLVRSALEKAWDCKCPLTGISISALLRASHAKPWKDCTDAEGVDPYNGFLLEARMDALFDQGYISFADDGILIVSPRLTVEDRLALGLHAVEQKLPQIAPAHLPYLRWHRE